MIDAIHVCKVATFGTDEACLSNLSKFNYIYGTNGSGKTTISRVIAGAEAFPTCKVVWKDGNKLQTLVYNRDFVDRNFAQNDELKGIFTLGEELLDTQQKIAAAKKVADELTQNITALTKTLQGDDGRGGKIGELEVLESFFKEKCWAQKQKHDAVFFGPFEGVRSNAVKFKDRVIKEHGSNVNAAETLDHLQKRADTLFGPAPSVIATLPDIDDTEIVALETSAILQKRVLGRTDVDIAAMIQKLGNSDWVKEGQAFYQVNDKMCPFCQKQTTDGFAKSLTDYFDESFVTDSKTIDSLVKKYGSSSEALQAKIDGVIKTNSRFLDCDQLTKEKQLIDAIILSNLQKLEQKKKEPSIVTELSSISGAFNAAKQLITSASKQIAEHNQMVSNLAQERKTLTDQVWRYLLDVELKADIADYIEKKKGVAKAIASLEKQIEEAKKNRQTKTTEIQRLEKTTTSIQPTIDAINALLSSFGFRGFKLAEGQLGLTYKLIRMDGSTAKDTLSEGEKTFVTFLYFYNLLKGSDTASGITTYRVVVIDDPVSSLDSDILFIVGSLIKGLFEEIREDIGYIKQIFVLTHNVFFHKEVSFNPKRKDTALREETFWIVRKLGLDSRIENYKSNPIKTSYELLWEDVRKPSPSNLSLQNTLRRILESYFRILGNVDPDNLCKMFAGKQQLICKSLFSWVNDGSHSAHDDLFVSVDGSLVATYLEVFRLIFVNAGHLQHYKMMMGDSYTEIVPCDTSPTNDSVAVAKTK